MKAGDKVVCVNESPCAHCGTPSLCKVSRTYCIEESRIYELPGGGSVLMVRIVGIPIHFCTQKGDTFPSPTWPVSTRFRKIDDLKQEARQLQG